MLFSLLLTQQLAFAKPKPQILRMNAMGEILTKVPSLKKDKPYRFSIQFTNPEESKDATFILRYDCINKAGESFFSEEVSIVGKTDKRFLTNVSATLDKKCTKKSVQVSWNMYLTRSSDAPVQFAVHEFIRASNTVEELINQLQKPSAYLAEDPDEKKKIARTREAFRSALLELNHQYERLASLPDIVLEKIEKDSHIHLHTPLLIAEGDELFEPDNLASLRKINRKYFAPYWKGLEHKVARKMGKKEAYIRSLSDKIADLKQNKEELEKDLDFKEGEEEEEAKFQIAAINSEIDIVTTELDPLIAEHKVEFSTNLQEEFFNQFVEDQSVEVWPLKWLANGVIYKENPKSKRILIDVSAPDISEHQIKEKSQVSLFLYNQTEPWELEDIKKTTRADAKKDLGLPINALDLLPGSKTLNLAVSTIDMLFDTRIGNVLGKLRPVTREIGSVKEKEYPPPPKMRFHTKRPVYHYQEINLGSFSGNQDVDLTLKSPNSTFEQTLVVDKLKHTGIRIGGAYINQMKTYSDTISLDDNGKMMWDGSTPDIDMIPQQYSLELLYGMAIYSNPAWLSNLNPEYRLPVHLFIGSSYDGKPIEDFLNSDNVLKTFLGVGADIGNGLGVLGGVHFGEVNYLSYNDNSFEWSLDKGYGMRGYFIGLSGDLRLERLLDINLFTKKEEE